MAGGNFNKLAGKVRPGTYINFESTRQDILGLGERGTVLIPLIGHSYGPAKEFIRIERGAPDAFRSMLGFSVFDNNPAMLLIREAFKNARTCVVYIPNQGAKAVGTSGTLGAAAKYGGSRGNDLRFSVTVNPIGGFDVTVYLGTATVSEYSGLETIEDLVAQGDAWIDFRNTGATPAPLVPIASVNLTGGVDGNLVASDLTEFLDKGESQRWDVLAFPLEADPTNSNDPAPGLFAAVLTKIRYLREDVGKYRKAVVPNFVADYEGIINVSNAVALGPQLLTIAQTTAWVAGIDAGASNTQSNTYAQYVGATDIVGLKNHQEAVAAINNGEFFFSFSEAGQVIVEYDINSLTTFRAPKDKTYRKNRILRVFDSFADIVMANFPPNRFDNSPTGWDIMEGIGRAILLQFEEAGAITNVDFDADFLVDRSTSSGDETYFNIGLQAVDSAEKLFFTVKTR